VSGDSDIPIIADYINNGPLTAIIENPFLIAWFAQNLKTAHQKLFNLPIGNDYHTMTDIPGLWGLVRETPISQENLLFQILKESPDISERIPLAYCNWQFAIQRGDRLDCLNKLDKSTCFFEQHPLPRKTTWERQSKFMFTISPEGVGMDCHRTWESLMLGSIPIVKKNELHPLFDGLPVIQVADWSDVSSSLLIHHRNEFFLKEYDYSKLFLDYWKRKINGEKSNKHELLLSNIKSVIC